MAVYLISDTHFFHTKVATLRGFDSYEVHDAALIKAINKRVTANDTLYILGDVVSASNGLTWRDNLSIVDKLNGHKHLIAGNHDRCAPNMTNGHLYQAAFLEHFESVSTQVRLRVKGYEVMLSHYPYEINDAPSDIASNAHAYEAYQLRDLGMPVIHGHTHTSQLLTLTQKGTPQINVNVESLPTWLQPVSLSDIAALLEPFSPFDDTNNNGGTSHA